MSGDRDGALAMTTGAKIADAFKWNWLDVRELIAWGLPFAQAGAADDAEEWQFATPYLLPWIAGTAELLGRYHVKCQVAELPAVLRGVRLLAGIALVTPCGFAPFGDAPESST